MQGNLTGSNMVRLSVGKLMKVNGRSQCMERPRKLSDVPAYTWKVDGWG